MGAVGFGVPLHGQCAELRDHALATARQTEQFSYWIKQNTPEFSPHHGPRERQDRSNHFAALPFYQSCGWVILVNSTKQMAPTQSRYVLLNYVQTALLSCHLSQPNPSWSAIDR